MHEHLRMPDRVLDITALPGLDRIEASGDGLMLGALVRMSGRGGSSDRARSLPGRR